MVKEDKQKSALRKWSEQDDEQLAQNGAPILFFLVGAALFVVFLTVLLVAIESGFVHWLAHSVKWASS